MTTTSEEPRPRMNPNPRQQPAYAQRGGLVLFFDSPDGRSSTAVGILDNSSFVSSTEQAPSLDRPSGPPSTRQPRLDKCPPSTASCASTGNQRDWPRRQRRARALIATKPSEAASFLLSAPPAGEGNPRHVSDLDETVRAQRGEPRPIHTSTKCSDRYKARRGGFVTSTLGERPRQGNGRGGRR